MNDQEMIAALDEIIVAVRAMATRILESENLCLSLTSYYSDAVNAMNRVRDLHSADPDGDCFECKDTSQYGGQAHIVYPCPTIKALDGEQA